MALKVTFDRDFARLEQSAIKKNIEADILKIMRYAGEIFVRDARLMKKEDGGFGDVTGNLRASIGYFILKNGVVIEEKFEDQRQIAKQAAEAVLNTIGYSSNYKLVGVAGMDYASAVESRGLNVISMQADVAIIDLQRYFKEVERKYRA